jgi:hypothetical protein
MRRLLLIAALMSIVSIAPAAWARSEKVEPYEATEVFPTAVRFLRIDAGVKIVEKDADAGYVLFDLTEDHKTFHGSLELIKTDVDGRVSVKLVLHIEDRPAYVEQLLLDKLDAKLRAELRPTRVPPKKPPVPAPPSVKDAPSDGSASEK